MLETTAPSYRIGYEGATSEEIGLGDIDGEMVEIKSLSTTEFGLCLLQIY